jgi:hypothetical protein
LILLLSNEIPRTDQFFDSIVFEIPKTRFFKSDFFKYPGSRGSLILIFKKYPEPVVPLKNQGTAKHW